MLEEIIRTSGYSYQTFCEEIITTFGNYGNEDNYYDYVVNAILTSFSKCPFINNQINSCENLFKYACQVMEVAKFAMNPIKNGSNNVYSIGLDNARVVEQLIGLIQENVTQDLASLARIISTNKYPSTNKDTLNCLFMIKALIQNSKDLQRFAQFVELLFESGFNVKDVLMGHMDSVFHNTPPLFGSYTYYKRLEALENYTKNYGLDGVLSLMEAAFIHGINPVHLINPYCLANEFGLGHTLLQIQNASSITLIKLRTYISEICTQAKNIYGSSANQVMEKIFNCLNRPDFYQRIQTPEDFRLYANQMMRVSKCLDNPYHYLDTTFTFLTGLIRENFDQDLEILIQLMEEEQIQLNKTRDFRVTSPEPIIAKLPFIKDFIRNSKDVQRITQFVQRLFRAGFYAQNLLCTTRAYNNVHESTLFGDSEQLQRWRPHITNSKELDEVLSVFEMSISFSKNEKEFASILKFVHKMTDLQLTQFILNAIPLSKKNISVQFVAEYIHLLNELDLTQNGLAIFSNFDGKAKWLEYCGNQLTTNPQSISTVAPFFNEALSLPATDKIHETAFNTLKRSILHLCVTDDFSTLQEINKLIEGTFRVLSEIDRDDGLALVIAKNMRFDAAFLNFFKDPLVARTLLPNTFYSATMKVYERILSRNAPLPNLISYFTAFYNYVRTLPSNEMLQEKYLDLLIEYVETLR